MILVGIILLGIVIWMWWRWREGIVKFCAHCEREFPPSRQRCSWCGRVLAEMKRKEIKGGSRK
jgi:rRNA maturation endonuclease Nob1